MKSQNRVINAGFLALAVGVAFGAGYASRASQYPTQWRWPETAGAKTQLTRTANGNIMVSQSSAKPAPSRAYKPDLRPYETLDEVRRAIKENYVQTKVSDTEITYGAIRGMLRSLGDRYTRFMTPEDYNEFLVSNKGEFTGIGARIDIKDDYEGSAQARPLGASRPYIVEPMQGGPAEKAGIKRGDVILAINGRSTADMGEDAVISTIRGNRGTVVKLKIERRISDPKIVRDVKYNVFDLDLKRDVIELHPVKLEWLPGDIAWLRLDEFNEKTDAEFSAALRKVKAGNLGKPAQGLILDMRSNPGGLLTSAVDVGSRFINSGPIVITKERGGAMRPYNAKASHFLGVKTPIVVLVDGYSASAAEIITGALKDKKLATVVGEPTFGKASVQVLVDLKNGGALVITTAKYLTPLKHDISDKGITPDVLIKASAEDEKSGRGAQLQKAVDVLRNRNNAALVAAKAD